MYLLGYIPAHNQVYLADKDTNIYRYSLSLNVVEYQIAVLQGDMDAAAEILPTLPKDQLNKVASRGTTLRSPGVTRRSGKLSTSHGRRIRIHAWIRDAGAL